MVRLTFLFEEMFLSAFLLTEDSQNVDLNYKFELLEDDLFLFDFDSTFKINCLIKYPI
jgi:hypothetical protein